MNQTYSVVITTVSNLDNAKNMAKAIVQNKLAACVQLMPITSFYSWEGKINEDSEIILLIKTRRKLFLKLQEFILKTHQYKIPEIIELPISDGFNKYFDWINGVTP